MTTARRCPKCGGEIADDAPGGLCPACLARAGLATETVRMDAPGADTGIHTAPWTAPSDPAEIARRFPQLELLEVLGRGGMGVVYKARQSQLDRLVALKVLPPELAKTPGFAERFSREARALARLNHPNIVAVYDFGQAEGLYYFLMEYVDGSNLRHLIQSRQITPEAALAIVPKICEALQFAHDEGILHRDIKPENILIDRKGRVKIADFGLAKLSGAATPDYTLTQPGMMMGTPRYMAPEQVENAKGVDHRADIYSLGVVFYEMLTGELPMGRFAPPSQKVHVDVRLDEVVLKTLEQEPARRYQHASEVKTDVESIAGPGPSGTPKAAAAAPPAPGARMPSGRRHLRIRADLLARVTGWVGLLIAIFAVAWPWVWQRWPCAYREQWDLTLAPASGAYRSVTLSAGRNLYYWGLRWDNRLLSKKPWTPQAKIDLTEAGKSATLYFDPRLERWGYARPGRQTPEWEVGDSFRASVADRIISFGIFPREPSMKEELTVLTGFLKDAANGIAPGGRSPAEIAGYGSRTAKVGSFNQVGEAHHSIVEAGMVGLPARAPGALVLGPLSMVVLIPGIAILVRRHRRRLAAAGEAEQRYRLGTIGFWVAVLCLLGGLPGMELPWVVIPQYNVPVGFGLGAFHNWHGTACVLAFFALGLFCFVTDFLGVGRRWQPRAVLAGGVFVVLVTGLLFWRLTGPAMEQAGLLTTVGSSHAVDVGKWGWGRGPVARTLEQEAGAGTWLAFALGLALLVLGGIAMRRARGRPPDAVSAPQGPLPPVVRTEVTAAFATAAKDRRGPEQGPGGQAGRGAQAPDETPSRAASRDIPQFSRKSIWAVIWACGVPLAILAWLYPLRATFAPESAGALWRLIPGWACCLAGASAAVGAPLLGLLAMHGIRHSSGRIVGLPLAFGTAIVLPLLLLALALAYAFGHMFAGMDIGIDPEAKAIVTLSVPLITSFFVAVAAWRKVRPPVVASGSVTRAE